MTGRTRTGLAVLLTLVGSIASAPAAGAQANQGNQGATKEKGAMPTPQQVEAAKARTARLFGPQEPLEFTLTSDYRKAFRSKDTLDVPRTPATLTVKDSTGKDVVIPLEIAPRGHFRLQRLNCGYPPIRLIFGDSGRKGTPFAGQEALKLGTHCRSGDKEFEEIPLKEHLLYRWYALLTDASFRTRLVKVTYVDAGRDNKTETKWGIILESDEDMGKRLGGRERELRQAMFLDMDQHTLLTALIYEYAIANHDWSLYSLHNMRIVATEKAYIPVIYDFDFSGAARTPYSGPPPNLGIRKVTDRLYRGPCKTANDLMAVLANFQAKKDHMLALPDSIPGLSSGYARWVRDYMDEFFRSTKDERTAMRSIMGTCNEKPSAALPLPGPRVRAAG